MRCGIDGVKLCVHLKSACERGLVCKAIEPKTDGSMVRNGAYIMYEKIFAFTVGTFCFIFPTSNHEDLIETNR